MVFRAPRVNCGASLVSQNKAEKYRGNRTSKASIAPEGIAGGSVSIAVVLAFHMISSKRAYTQCQAPLLH